MISFLPGFLAWWRGRRLAALLDDPAIAERYLAYRGRNLLNLVTALVVVGYLASSRLLPGLTGGCLLVAVAGAFPARKRILGESWHFLAYLEYYLRFVLAFSAFRLLLGFTPWLLSIADGWLWPAAGTLGALLFGWLLWGASIAPIILGARTLKDPELLTRFAAIANRAGLAMPRILVTPSPGGGMANAFALPGRPVAQVVFTATLLDALTPPQAEAIFAHEAAHLEDMGPAFLRNLLFGASLLIVLALAMVPAAEFWIRPGALSGIWALLAGLINAGLLHFLVRHGRHHEAESDRRAVELCGDGEALIDGLTRLHQLNCMPRRWDTQSERLSSHPSLANRIRAIRGGAPANPPENPVAVGSTHPGRWVVLEHERMHWLEGVPEDCQADPATLLKQARLDSAAAYSELRELVLKPQPREEMRLEAMARNGDRWSMPVRAEDLKLAQAILTQIDLHIDQSGVGNDRGQLTRLLVVTIALTGVAAWSETSLPVLALMLVALMRPRSWTLAAAAWFGFGTALAEWAQYPSQTEPYALLATALIGGVYALNQRQAEPPDRRLLIGLTAFLGLALLPGWIAMALAAGGDLPALRLLHSAQVHTGAAAGLLGLAGLLLATGQWRRRFAATAITIGLAGVPLLLGSAHFAEHYAGDAFADPALPLRLSRIENLRPIREFAVDGYASDLTLSPGGEHYAYRSAGASYGGNRPIVVGHSLHGAGAALEVDDLAFLDDLSAITLSIAGDGQAAVQLLRLSGQQWKPLRKWPVPATTGSKLTAGGDRWQLSGYDTGSRTWVVAEGVAGDSPPQIRRFGLPADPMQLSRSWGETALWQSEEFGEGLLGVTVDPGDSAGSAILSMALGLASSMAPATITRFWTTSGDQPPVLIAATTRTLSCSERPSGLPRIAALCRSFGQRSRFALLDPEARRFTAVYGLATPMDAVFGTAERPIAVSWQGTPVLLDLAAGTATELVAAGTDPSLAGAAWAGNRVLTAAMAYEGNEVKTTIRLYDLTSR